MSADTQHLHYPNVLPRGTVVNLLSTPILAADFKTLKLSFGSDAAADYDVVVYGSYNPITDMPDLSIAAGPDNEYHLLGYVDESDGVSYDGNNPFNPTSVAVVKGFNIETSGVTWIIVGIDNRVAGTVEFMNVDLFSNHN